MAGDTGGELERAGEATLWALYATRELATRRRPLFDTGAAGTCWRVWLRPARDPFPWALYFVSTIEEVPDDDRELNFG